MHCISGDPFCQGSADESLSNVLVRHVVGDVVCAHIVDTIVWWYKVEGGCRMCLCCVHIYLRVAWLLSSTVSAGVDGVCCEGV